MLLRSIPDLFVSNFNTLNIDKEESHILHDNITGFDISDVERRATVENLAAWHVCSAAWSIVLSRHTLESSLDCLATYVPRQNTPNGCDVGSFLSVHASIDEDTTFAELLHKASDFSIHNDKLAFDTASSIVVICPTTFSAGPTELPLPPQTKSDVTIQLLSTRSKVIQATCRYRSGLPSCYVEKVVHHFLHLLRYIINHKSWASLYIRDISMSSLQEDMQLRHDGLPSRSLADMELGSVHQLFRRQARRTPSRPALEGPSGDVISYLELDLISDLMEADLRRRLSNVSPSHLNTGLTVESAAVVGIMMQRSPAVVIAILSCWKAGYAIVLVDPSQPASRNGQIVENCHCALLLVDKSWTGSVGKDIAWNFDFESLRDRLKTCDDSDTAYRQSEIEISKDFFRPAWFRVTSGSTGTPKCALHSHATFGSSISSYRGRVRASKSLLFFNPISSASGNAIWSFLTNGACVCIPPQEEMVSDLAGCINRYGIDDVCITPSALALTSPEQVPSLKTVALVGEATPRSLAQKWSHHVSILIGYGATEMNSHALPFHDEPTGILAPAHPLPNSDYSLYILQPATMQLCPLYVPGEICLSSTYMSSGYINMPEATSKVFVPHPFPGDAGHSYIYRTGDLGMFIAPRCFVILGRVDFQFKLDGNRIQPEEIESVVNQVPKVIESRVILVKPTVGPPVSTCCVILESSSTNGLHIDSHWKDFVSGAEKACSNHLPKYMMPHRWLKFEKFPETLSAKTDTKALAIEAKKIIDNETTIAMGGNDQKKKFEEHISMEGKVFLDLVLETLTGNHPNELSADMREKMQAQSFLANGGTSLLSLQLRSQLRSRGLDITISQLYSPQSLVEIASDFSTAEGGKAMVQAQESGPALTVTEFLRSRMPTDIRPELTEYETIFPTTMLQREIFVLSMLDPKLWIFYQFMDLSQVSCTTSQLHEAIILLVSAKPNLRTVFSLVNVQSNPATVENPDSAFDLIKSGQFVHAILKSDAISIRVSQEDHIEEPEAFWRQDVNTKWSFEKLLWRVTFLSKPRLLAWTFNHAIVDEWVARNISRDLYAVLTAILDRDNTQKGQTQALTDACENARKPSIEKWPITHYGTHGLTGSSTPVVEKHTKIWENFMANASPTPIPDDLKLPYSALPAPPFIKNLESLPYGEWCRQHHVTAAALFHAAASLTIARLLNWWRPGGPHQTTEEVTYYRISSNRNTISGASDMEGALISISPMRVPVAASADPVAIAQAALKNWIATYESDPYYLDGQLIHTGPEPTARQRRWGNVLLNHIYHNPDKEDSVPSFRGVAEDKCGFAMVWPFAALELTVVETNPKSADSLQLCVLSTLEQQSTEDFIHIFVDVLRAVIETNSRMSAMEIVQQLS
ncbi:hypothetical protein BGW36DRAFT_426490 [Talaromyces proteolyticus]|uniref:AMP-dependent synthetase/ligase domain-containing protein n=1 Tax=Talaromyces proteolyticus TaxID=1131652 RepID=A0AAD4PZ98_9EURO|nr:uncharacterized protein BGW36DRAFT_426490 [Talaromyces proteolyticus]KAH8698801.1 hypothetical protein BGW36DRAFT_426490 [Talaromyces proteolyticus]